VEGLRVRNITIKAHFDGEHIVLDEPFTLTAEMEISVVVVEGDDAFYNPYRNDWLLLSEQGLAASYGEDEPEYSESDLRP
jgi:hypothetical protein